MKTILVASDQATGRELVRVALEHFGYAVHESGDGPAAISSARQIEPDLIILDWHVAGSNTLATIRKIRQDPQLARIPVLALTAGAVQADHDRALAAGFSGCLPKPVHLSGLRKEVERLLR